MNSMTPINQLALTAFMLMVINVFVIASMKVIRPHMRRVPIDTFILGSVIVGGFFAAVISFAVGVVLMT
jgi:hypothetical protein